MARWVATCRAKSLRTLIEAAHLPPAALIERLRSHADGLTGIEADAIRETSGPNTVDHERPMPWWVHLWHCYANPFNLLLTLLSVVSYLTEDVKATIVIGSMVVLSTLLRFVQESRSNRAADRLKEMVTTTVTAMRRDVSQLAAPEASRYFGIELAVRPARRVELPIRDLVPGDIVALAAGDMVPADLRVITAKDLFVSQSALTGESLPVEKFAVAKDASTASALDLDTVCFMGTNVVSGSATAIVVATGNRTYFGALAERVTAVDTRPTAFQVGVNKISWLLIRFMLAMTPLVFLLNGFTKGDWLQAFLFAISIAVGLTPEMLPMIVTATLAKGAVQLSKKKVIVKRLDAIQNFGAMDVLCTDKTGTLTQDRIVLERCIDATGQWTGQEAQRVLEYAYLNSYYQTGLKNLLDRAVLAHAEMNRALSPGHQLSQGRRDPVRLRAAPHVGDRLRARGPSRADLQGRGRGDRRSLLARAGRRHDRAADRCATREHPRGHHGPERGRPARGRGRGRATIRRARSSTAWPTSPAWC